MWGVPKKAHIFKKMAVMQVFHSVEKSNFSCILKVSTVLKA